MQQQLKRYRADRIIEAENEQRGGPLPVKDWIARRAEILREDLDRDPKVSKINRHWMKLQRGESVTINRGNRRDWNFWMMCSRRTGTGDGLNKAGRVELLGQTRETLTFRFRYPVKRTNGLLAAKPPRHWWGKRGEPKPVIKPHVFIPSGLDSYNTPCFECQNVRRHKSHITDE